MTPLAMMTLQFIGWFMLSGHAGIAFARAIDGSEHPSIRAFNLAVCVASVAGAIGVARGIRV